MQMPSNVIVKPMVMITKEEAAELYWHTYRHYIVRSNVWWEQYKESGFTDEDVLNTYRLVRDQAREAAEKWEQYSN